MRIFTQLNVKIKILVIWRIHRTSMNRSLLPPFTIRKYTNVDTSINASRIVPRRKVLTADQCGREVPVLIVVFDFYVQLTEIAVSAYPQRSLLMVVQIRIKFPY